MTRDEYHLNVCKIVASNSRCLSRQIGVILVRDNHIICTGYNGPPVGFRHCEKVTSDPGVCPRKVSGFVSGEGLKYCPANHAEANVIATAAKMGICTEGATMCMTCGIPCKSCFGLILNAGIKKLVVTSSEFYDELSEEIMKSSITDIHVRMFSHL
jgi:dCMP deaminase